MTGYIPTTSKDFVEPRYYSQYDEKDVAILEEALEASREIQDVGERIESVVAYLKSKHILCGMAQRILIFDAIHDEGPLK